MNIQQATLLALLFCSVSAWGHHILGTPHYAYDEEYPQTPTLTYSAEMGAYKVDMTCFPGKPKPGDNTSLHFYIQHLETSQPFSDSVTLTVFKDHLMGDDLIVYGPIEGELEEAMFKFFPQFMDEANYIVRLEYFADGAPWILDLPIVAGEPGSPWKVVGGIAIVFGVFFIVIRAIRIKKARRIQKEARLRPETVT
jgi:hypothetical protein